MADADDPHATRREWRLAAPAGFVAFAATFAAIQYFGPVTAWANALPPAVVSLSAAAAVALLTMAATAMGSTHRLRLENRRMRVALNTMSQGLCMFDANERLVLSNKRYAEIYKLNADLSRPGITLLDVLAYRAATGSFAHDPQTYRRQMLAVMARGETTATEMKSPDGRIIAVVNRPMAGGGWVGTHEDITERRNAERERNAMQEQQQRRETIERAISAFRRSVEHHLHTVADGAMTMRATATTLFASSGDTSKSAESAVSCSNESSVNVETAAIAADELARSIAEIGRQLTMTTDVVRGAVNEAQDTNARIAALAEAAQKIGDVVKLIHNIAGQTNLLALNATIEAARAGDAGKGFAVVASEVKSLAVQTAKATEDISRLIASVQGATGGAVAAIGRIADRMQEIDRYANAVSAAVGQQSAATAEISQNVAGAAEGAKMVVSELTEVSGMAAETRTSAENVLTAAQAVEAAAAGLAREVEDFLGKVAA